MPYRRLPNTDQARLSALRKAVTCASEADFNERVIKYQTLTDAQKILMRFENQVCQYHDNFNSRVSANKNYKKKVQNARMYISHFIQVLNLAVIRGEIKKEQKELYHLDTDNNTLPDLSTEEDLLIWGKNIIEGETERTRLGGFPIYNPTISKVRAYYEDFKEHQVNQHLHRKTENRTYENLETLREETDAIILDIWNQVESYYADLYPYERMQACQKYGMIYYYRPKEERLSAETDKKLKRAEAAQVTLQWSDSE